MQQPTLQNVKIRSTRDALRIFNGVARNVLPLITRRLDAEERRAIVPGNVYVWEERGSNTEVTGLGMERWTDGMGWGPSRVREEMLFYHQKESEYHEEATGPMTPWAQMVSLYPIPRSRATSDAERLIKQTYSVHVSLPADRPRGITRKWHITAYFSQQKLDGLEPIDNVPGVGDVPVPEGLFRSARATKSRRNGPSSGPSNNSQPPLESVIPPAEAPLASTSSFPAQPVFTASFPQPGSFDRVDSHPSFSLASSTPRIYSEAVSDNETLPSHQVRYSGGILRHRSHSPPSMVPSQSYRDSSPPYARQSRSLSPYERSPSASSSVPATPSPVSAPVSLGALGGNLVPLEHLQNNSYPRRDPIDEQLLSRFSTQLISSSCIPRMQSSAVEYASAL